MIDTRTERERARVLLSMRRYEDAARMLAVLVAAEPDDAQTWCLLAQAELGAGRSREGLKSARRAMALEPAGSWPHRLASIALQRMGDSRAAVEAALDAARLEPHDWVSHLSVAQAAVGARDYTGEGGMSRLAIAGRAVAAARQLAPDEAEVHYFAGQVSREAGDQDAAIRHFQRALASDPAHAGALNELGRISLDRGRTGQAAEHFIQAARTAPGESVYGRNVAVAVARMEASSHRLVAWVIYLSWLLAVFALISGPAKALNWAVTVTVLVIVAAVVAAMVWMQLRRLPKQARVLFKGGYLALALGVSLSSLAIGVPASQYAVARIPIALLPVLALMIAARFGAFLILKRGAARRRAQLLRSHA
jgi:tetratricopeptide (TPR) repeat protein